MIGNRDTERPQTSPKPCGLTQSLFAPAIALALSLFVSAPAWATGSVLSGMFDGSEPALDSLAEFECARTPLGYVQSTFAVSASGTYYFNDAFGTLRRVGGVDVTAHVYEGSFNPSTPGENLIASARVDYPANEVVLSARTTYTLVVQLACAPSEGAWAVAFAGPGTLDSDHAVALPSFTSGTLAEDGPIMYSNCADAWGPYTARYQQSGPIRVSHTGTYYFSTAGIYGLCLSVYSAPVDPARQSVNFVGGAYEEGFELRAGQDYYILVQSHNDLYGFEPTAVDVFGEYLVCLSIYTAPVDPLNPAANRVAMLGGYDLTTAELQAGRDYYFVTQWNGDEIDDSSPNSAGEFLHILMPPARVRVNRGLAGSWYDPDTPGQGFFLTVYEKLNQVFLGWFTYAIDPPAGDHFGHRWMTAFGPFADTSAELAISWTAGGRFDIANPAPEQHQNGVIELEFTDCTSGQMTYSWSSDEPGSPAASGVIPIERIANDSVVLCESLYAGPGMPGPL